MKNIETILTESKVELTAEQKADILKAVADNYKTINEFEKQKLKLETAQGDLAKAQDDIKNISTEFEGKSAEQWKAELDKINGDWQKEKADRELAEKQAQELAELQERFAKANEGKGDWRDDLTGTAVFELFKTARNDKANKAKGDSDILSEIEKDQNYRKNPNAPTGNMPSAKPDVQTPQGESKPIIQKQWNKFSNL